MSLKDKEDSARRGRVRSPSGPTRGEPPPPALPTPITAAKCGAHPVAANNANNATLIPAPGCELAPCQALLKAQGLLRLGSPAAMSRQPGLWQQRAGVRGSGIVGSWSGFTVSQPRSPLPLSEPRPHTLSGSAPVGAW